MRVQCIKELNEGLLRMKPISKILTMTVMAAALGLAGCSEDEPKAPIESVHKIKASTETVVLGEIPLMAVVPGAVMPEQRASISSRLTGYIKGLEVKVGQRVKRGDLLFSIDSADIKNQITRAGAEYQQALAAFKDAKLDFERFAKLYEEDSVSKQQYDKIRLQFSVAQQSLAAAASGFKQAKEQLIYANVKAPFDGVIVDKMAVAGDLAAPGKPVVIIENSTSLSVQTEVAGDLFAVLRLGDEAQVMLDGQSEPFTGVVYTLVGAANPKTRTHTVKLSLPKDVVNINSGTFARVSYKRGTRQTMMIPKSAVVTRGGIEGVFVVEDTKASFHMVRTGVEINGKIEVQSGLALDDVIVTDNNVQMLNGDVIEPMAGEGV